MIPSSDNQCMAIGAFLKKSMSSAFNVFSFGYDELGRVSVSCTQRLLGLESASFPMAAFIFETDNYPTGNWVIAR